LDGIILAVVLVLLLIPVLGYTSGGKVPRVAIRSGAWSFAQVMNEWRRTNRALERIAETYERDTQLNHGDEYDDVDR
jgi:hypothetical protein